MRLQKLFASFRPMTLTTPHSGARTLPGAQNDRCPRMFVQFHDQWTITTIGQNWPRVNAEAPPARRSLGAGALPRRQLEAVF